MILNAYTQPEAGTAAVLTYSSNGPLTASEMFSSSTPPFGDIEQAIESFKAIIREQADGPPVHQHSYRLSSHAVGSRLDLRRP